MFVGTAALPPPLLPPRLAEIETLQVPIIAPSAPVEITFNRKLPSASVLPSDDGPDRPSLPGGWNVTNASASGALSKVTRPDTGTGLRPHPITPHNNTQQSHRMFMSVFSQNLHRSYFLGGKDGLSCFGCSVGGGAGFAGFESRGPQPDIPTKTPNITTSVKI
jgi:hypothetical protein